MFVLLQIKAEIPEKRMRFTRIENKEENESYEEEHEDQDIRAVFTIIQRPSFMLNGGEALITFEEEKGKASSLKMYDRLNVV